MAEGFLNGGLGAKPSGKGAWDPLGVDGMGRWRGKSTDGTSIRLRALPLLEICAGLRCSDQGWRWAKKGRMGPVGHTRDQKGPKQKWARTTQELIGPKYASSGAAMKDIATW